MILFDSLCLSGNEQNGLLLGPLENRGGKKALDIVNDVEELLDRDMVDGLGWSRLLGCVFTNRKNGPNKLWCGSKSLRPT